MLFGYILPYKSELKVGEYEIYKAVYCGLCKRLGSIFGPFAKLTLSYDFAFLALFELSLKEDCPKFKKKSCAANPLLKRNCLMPCAPLDFSACAAMIMMYYKLKDNIADGGFFSKTAYRAFLLPFAAMSRNKGKKLFPQIDSIVSEAMTGQFAAEKEGVGVDRAADHTAAAMGRICELMADDVNTRQVLYRFGYQIGRYVYLVDALDDLDKDIKKGNFNPFTDETALCSAVETITLTIGQIAEAYTLIETKRFAPIIENVIYLGLKDTVDKIRRGKPRKGV